MKKLVPEDAEMEDTTKSKYVEYTPLLITHSMD
jgi:hypothetical protein